MILTIIFFLCLVFILIGLGLIFAVLEIIGWVIVALIVFAILTIICAIIELIRYPFSKIFCYLNEKKKNKGD